MTTFSWFLWFLGWFSTFSLIFRYFWKKYFLPKYPFLGGHFYDLGCIWSFFCFFSHHFRTFIEKNDLFWRNDCIMWICRICEYANMPNFFYIRIFKFWLSPLALEARAKSVRDRRKYLSNEILLVSFRADLCLFGVGNSAVDFGMSV